MSIKYWCGWFTPGSFLTVVINMWKHKTDEDKNCQLHVFKIPEKDRDMVVAQIENLLQRKYGS